MPEMPRSWVKWLSFLLVALVALFVWHHWSMTRGLLSLAAVQVSYGAGFALCAVFLLGLLARLRISSFPAIWRMLSVLLGAGLAALEIVLHSYTEAPFFALWAAAVIGVSAISLVARYAPPFIVNLWLGHESLGDAKT